MIFSRSRTKQPQSILFTIDVTLSKESDDLDILGLTIIDSKKTFEMHRRSVSRTAASQRLGTYR